MYFFREGEVEVTQKLTLKAGRQGFSQAEKSMVRLRAGRCRSSATWRCSSVSRAARRSPRRRDCVLYEISRDDFERVSAANPALGYKIMRRIAPRALPADPSQQPGRAEAHHGTQHRPGEVGARRETIQPKPGSRRDGRRSGADILPRRRCPVSHAGGQAAADIVSAPSHSA